MKEQRNYTPQQVIEGQNIKAYEDARGLNRTPTIEQTERYWNQLSTLAIYAGYPSDYVMDSMKGYIRHDNDWPEGKRDFRMALENVIGAAIASKLYPED